MQKQILPHHILALCEVLECEPDEIIGEADNYNIPTIVVNK
jgi:DNA-binding Xre family transcriptional regulator